MGTAKWHGHTDANTSAKMFWYDRDGASPDIHIPQFNAVWDRLHTLALVRDANNYPVVQLIFTRRQHSSPVIAYRFTSDWAHDQYNAGLCALGLSLGRGVWDPFKSRYDSDKFLGPDEDDDPEEDRARRAEFLESDWCRRG